MNGTPLCTQDHCAMRDPAAGPELVADLALACLSGRELDDVVDRGSTVLGRKVCRDCIRRVMAGRHPLPTPEEFERDLEAGRASHRRQRRRRAA